MSSLVCREGCSETDPQGEIQRDNATHANGAKRKSKLCSVTAFSTSSGRGQLDPPSRPVASMRFCSATYLVDHDGLKLCIIYALSRFFQNVCTPPRARAEKELRSASRWVAMRKLAYSCAFVQGWKTFGPPSSPLPPQMVLRIGRVVL